MKNKFLTEIISANFWSTLYISFPFQRKRNYNFVNGLIFFSNHRFQSHEISVLSLTIKFCSSKLLTYHLYLPLSPHLITYAPTMPLNRFYHVVFLIRSQIECLFRNSKYTWSRNSLLQKPNSLIFEKEKKKKKI